MCGRFSLKSTMKAIEDEFSIAHTNIILEPHYNIAPTQNIIVIVLDETKKLNTFQWGLIPAWVKDQATGNKTIINARSETILEKSSFKDGFKKRRCLILADGYYEWKKSTNEKVPMYIYLKSQRPFAFAGIWDTWKSPKGTVINSCAIITTKPNDLMASIHNRMPVILPKKDENIWLDISFQTEKYLLNLLKPYPSEEMSSHQVSKIVNSPQNDNPNCVKPVQTVK